MKNKTQKAKVFNGFRPMIRSRHETHNILRQELNRMPFRSVIRLGSTTDIADSVTNGGNRVEINTIQSVKNAANKLLMKKCFTAAEVPTAEWWTITTLGGGHLAQSMYNGQTDIELSDLPYPIVAKHIYGSRGTGNYLIKDKNQLQSWINGRDLNKYIFEKFYSYTREYRLHVTEDGCFYAIRKMLKNEAPQDDRWARHDDNSVWIMDINEEKFDKPVNWNSIVADCVAALEETGLSVGAFDIKIQSSKDKKGNLRENPKYILLEVNSAPSFGKVTAERYLQVLPGLLQRKAEEAGLI